MWIIDFSQSREEVQEAQRQIRTPVSLLACFSYLCNLRSLWIALLLLVPLVTYSQTQFVNPFVGTAGHGHTFPGASRPFGMVQLSPDTRLTGWDSCAGYHHSDDIIYGFTHTHLSGTGIPDYADILLMPTLGEVALSAFIGDNVDK